VVTLSKYAAFIRQSVIDRPAVDASEILRSACSIIVVLALAGCGAGTSTAGSGHADPEVQMETACYQKAESDYEAAGIGPNPNAALMNIGAALTAKDNAFEQCVRARGGKQTK
jgi:hypothetical protein